MTRRTEPATLRWDLHCRVVDNFGDIGVSWRLARRLAALGDRVRLFVDDASALAWMAPGGAEGVQVLAGTAAPTPAPGEAYAGAGADVIVETFGCDLPRPVRAGMARALAAGQRVPLWIDLEYLSAEAYVARSHARASPQTDALVRWFYFPGFEPDTGGLLREDGLLAERAGFDRDAWLSARGWGRRPGERVVVVFCYEAAALPDFLAALAATPTLVLLPPGPGRAALSLPGQAGQRRVPVPYLDQDGFDRLLWSADLLVVRGEDSLVRALWSGVPFIWHAYPQADGAHAPKLDALARMLDLPPAAQQAWRAWNLAAAWPMPPAWEGEAGAAWAAALNRARARIAAAPDLGVSLRRFAAQRLRPAAAPP